ncbi:uncharacterized protein LOC111682385 isoform X1 [Lucilia cuprina]|uniref:uncharacterized protein LOC111682385 isoform X1 n=1 Tax=Lucilia cuprina TaxID=7375 RepID=UPI001F05871E|nr:uncharacterized protein LOC111682385 isoform X1 [Lucilia cuprina]
MVSLQREQFNTNKNKSLQHLVPILLLLKDILKSDHYLCNIFEKDILDISENCQVCRKMAALPQGAFVACKLREQYRDRDLIISRLKSSGEKNEPKIFSGNKKLMEYSPVKYNEKLMNSIWGFYNRYSPHNIKSNEIVSFDLAYNQQQQSAVANQAIAHNIAMAVTTGKEWTFMDKK